MLTHVVVDEAPATPGNKSGHKALVGLSPRKRPLDRIKMLTENFLRGYG